MASGVPVNFDRKLRTALSSQSRGRSRSQQSKYLQGVRTQEPIRRRTISRNSFNMSSKNIGYDEGIITNITVRKKSTGAAKNRLSIDPNSRSKSPIISRKQSAITSKNMTKRST